MSNATRKIDLSIVNPAEPTNAPPTEGILKGDKLNALMSPYWAEGFKQDTHDLASVTINKNRIEAECKMKSFFISPTDPRFHLSVFNATDFICQAGIVHALFINGFESKQHEVLMTDIQMTLTKQVMDPTLIPITMEIYAKSVTTPSQSRKTPRSFYKWKFDVANGAWWGTVTLCFPFEAK